MASKKRTYAIDLAIRGKDLASGVIARVGKSLRGIAGIGRSVGGFLQSLPGLSILGSGITRIVGGVRDLALAASEAGSSWKDLAAQTGIGTRALQEVEYAAKQAGVSSEEYRASLLMLTKTLGKGVNRRQIFATLGKDARGFRKGLDAAKTAGAKFEVVLAQMANIRDPMKRAAFATLFFGRAGTKLAGAAADGAEGMRMMREEAQRLGLVMSDEDIDRADDFGDKWASLGMAFEGAKRSFGSGIIKGVLPGLRELLGLTKANGKSLGEMASEMGTRVGEGIVAAAKAIGEAVTWIVSNKDTIIDVAKNIAIAFAALKGIELVKGIGSVLVGGGAAGGAAAGSAGGAGAGLGVAGLARVVGGVAAAAVLLPDQGKIDAEGQRSRFALEDEQRRRRLRVLGPGLDGVAAPRGEAGFKAFEGFQAIADAVAVWKSKAFWSGFGATVSDGFATPNADPSMQFSDMMRPSLSSFTPPPQTQSIEVVVTVNDQGGVTDGKPEVKTKSAGNVKTKAQTKTGQRAPSHLKGWDV